MKINHKSIQYRNSFITINHNSFKRIFISGFQKGKHIRGEGFSDSWGGFDFIIVIQEKGIRGSRYTKENIIQIIPPTCFPSIIFPKHFEIFIIRFGRFL